MIELNVCVVEPVVVVGIIVLKVCVVD